jgi:hypothetical protein
MLFLDASTDRVGINVSAPAVDFDVAGIIRCRGGKYQLHDGTDAGGQLGFYKGIIGSGSSLSPTLFAESGLDLHFLTGGSATDKMIILANGNIGIGTTAPKNLLNVHAADGAPGIITISTGSDSTAISDNEEMGRIEFSAYDSDNTYAVGAKIVGRANEGWTNASTNYAGTDIEFYTQDATTSDNSLSTPRMVIDKNGFVGIGTAPIHHLHVETSVDSAYVAKIKNTSSTNSFGLMIDTAANTGSGEYILNCTTGAGTGFFVTSEAEVGIGTAAPDNLLEVSSTNAIAVSQSTVGDNTVGGVHIANLTDATDGAGSMLKFSTRDGANTVASAIAHIQLNSTSGRLAFYTESGGAIAEQMTILNTGYVGIGTVDPRATLELDQSTTDTRILKFVSGDVAHGMTDAHTGDVVAGDCYGTFRKWEPASGGLAMDGYCDSHGTNDGALVLIGHLGEAASTTKSDGGYGIIRMQGYIGSGNSAEGPPGSDSNLLSIEDQTAVRFIFDEAGEFHSDAVIGDGGDWDEWSDLQMASDLSRLPKAKFDEMMKYSAKDFEKAGLLTLSVDEEGNQHAFIKHKAMLMFSMCCFGETYKRIATLEEQNKYLVNELRKNNILKEEN